MLLGSAYGKIEIGASGVRRGVSDATTSLKSLQSKAMEVGRAMQDIGRKMTIGLTLPLIAIGGAAVKAASDFEETKNKSLVVFEEMADGVLSSSEQAAKALGINKEAYLDYASSIGAALKAGGMGIEETAALSEQAVKHFADLASFHNAEVENVARAWESAIRGQYEPIQRYFPFITNEYLKTYGVANGLLDANTKNLTANQRAIILNAIALDENLNPAIDDFAETSGGLANQTRIMQAQFKDLLVELGTNLLPIALEVVSGLNKILEAFNRMPPAAQKTIIGFGAFLAILGPLLSMLGTLLTVGSSLSGVLAGAGGISGAVSTVTAGFTGMGTAISGIALPSIGAIAAALGPLLLVLLAVGAQLALLKVAWEYNFLGMRSNMQASIGFWKNMWAAFTSWLRGDNDAALAHLQEGWATLTERLSENFGGFIEFMKNAWQDFVNYLSQMRDRIFQLFQVDWSAIGRYIVHGIASGLMSGASVLFSAVQNIAKTILDTLQNSLGVRSPSTKAAWLGQMTSEGYLQGMAAALDSRRIADALARPVSYVTGGAQMSVVQHFNTGLSIREAKRVVADNNEQMLRGIETALGDF